MEISIAKQQYTYSDQVNVKLPYEKWVNFIDRNLSYYQWLENTDKGKDRMANIEKIPKSFRHGILEQLNKTQAHAEFNKIKGYHEIILDFHKDIGVIKSTFMSAVTRSQLQKLLEMAEYLDAYLLKDGKEVLDKEKVLNWS